MKPFKHSRDYMAIVSANAQVMHLSYKRNVQCASIRSGEINMRTPNDTRPLRSLHQAQRARRLRLLQEDFDRRRQFALNEDQITVYALQAGMEPREIIAFLDNIQRWRKAGIGQ